MLIKFTVKNYAGFKDEIIFDLSSKRKINFQKELVHKGVVQKALVYGQNGSGKSSLCKAIMDITYHLVDKEKENVPDHLYFNVGTNTQIAEFNYYFKFESKIVRYSYAKYAPTLLAYEKLYVDGNIIFEYNYMDSSHNVNKIEEAQSLNLKGITPQMSALKYLYNNTILNEKSIITKLVKYVEGMLFFRSLTDGNMYIGYSKGAESLSSIIIRNGKTEEFKKFLQNEGLNYDIVEYEDANGARNLGIQFENGKRVPFSSIISSGTKTMWLFYCWMLEFQHLSLLIMDEFDAYYHYSTAQSILKIVNQFSNMQVIITTNNIALMNNDVTRPDTCFILTDNKTITPLIAMTKTEIRKKSNLSKMYLDGKFTNILV